MTNPFPKTLRHGRYRIEGTMMSGAAPTGLRSFLALDTRSGRRVVIRELTGDDPAQRRTALRTAHDLIHPLVVRFSDFFSEGGSYFVVRDYVPGRSLADVIAKSPGLPLNRVVRIGAKVSDALATAHNLGIIHGGLRPSNIVLTSPSGLKVIDFGLAGLGGVRHEHSEFTPPEWRGSGALDPRGDLFSLGATLCNMASPEPHGSLNTTLRRVDSPHFRRILQRMIEPNPSRRIQSAEEVYHSLQDLSTDLGEKTKRTTIAVTGHLAGAPAAKSRKFRAASSEAGHAVKKVSLEIGGTRKSKTGKRKARFVNTWMEAIGDPLPVKRDCWYKFALNIGQRRTDLASPFGEPDFGKSVTLDLLICLFSRDFEIERHQIVLTIPKEGESQVANTKVRALRAGSCRIDILICLRKELELLQSLAAEINVESNVKAVAAVSA